VLDEIDSASPQAQEAFARVVQNIPQIGAHPPADPAMPTASAPAMGQPSMRPPTPAPPASMVPPKTAPEQARQTEYDRLTQGPEAKSGVAQIKNPWLRKPLQILSGIGDAVLPGLTQGIPGTGMHHQALVGQAREAVDQDVEQRGAVAEERLRQAQAANQESLPELNQAKIDASISGQQSAAEIARLKQAGVDEHNRATEVQAQVTEQGKRDTAQAAVAARLRAAGFDPDTGDPLPDDGLSEPLKAQRALTELRGAQADATAAKAELDKAKAENAPEAAAIAQQRLQQAQQRLNIASQRLGLSGQQFEFRSQGTVGGVAPAGTILTDQGQPVGTANAPNVRPTGTQRTRADLATSALEQLQDMKTIVARHPEYFGPAQGRATDFSVWVGSQDPDAQAFVAARRTVADHGSGVFGARSAQAAAATEISAGKFKDNPDAILAGLGQLEKAFTQIGGQGTMRTVGSNAAAARPVVPPKVMGGGPKQVGSKQEYEVLPAGTQYIDADGKTYTKR
jgi:hypothetical protein